MRNLLFFNHIILLLALFVNPLIFSLNPKSPAGDIWTTGGPEGAAVDVFRIDPKNPSTIYAGSAVNNLYKSVDYGTHWTSLGLDDIYLQDLAIHPIDTNILYVAAELGVYKSIDGGFTWNKIVQGLGFSDNQTGARSIVINPLNPDTLYVLHTGSNGSGPFWYIFKSVDGGNHWFKSSNGLPEGRFVANDIFINPHNPENLYSGCYKSFDGGANWGLIAQPCPLVNSMSFDPFDPNHMVVAGLSLVESKDGGNTWQNLLGEASLVAFDPSRQGVIYATQSTWSATSKKYATVLKSENAGLDWTTVFTSFMGANLTSVTVDPHTSDRIYVSLRCGLYKSEDSGETWGPIQSGLPPAGLNTIIIDPVEPENVYAATFNGPLYKSTDSGKSWLITGNPYTDIQGIVVHPVNNNILYAANSFGVMNSMDGGQTWTEPSLSQIGGGDLRIRTLIMDPRNPEILYAGTNVGIARSHNAGEDWTLINGNLPGSASSATVEVSAIGIDPQDSNTIFIGTGYGIYRTTDNGKNWSLMNVVTNGMEPTSVQTIVFGPSNSNKMYAGDYFGVLVSEDKGTTWTRLHEVAYPTGAIVIDPENPSTIIINTGVNGIFKSDDGGLSWFRIVNWVSSISSKALAITPRVNSFQANHREGGLMTASSRYLYATLDGGRVYAAPLNQLGIKKIFLPVTFQRP